jgi:hypothetical protein
MAEVSQKPKTMLEQWVEPPLPTPRPSFADAGIQRHGVVQNMAPLGTHPTPKVIKMAMRPEEVLFGRRESSRKPEPSAVSTPSESVMTPEPPTNPTRARSASIQTITEAESAPQTPQQPPSARKSVSRQSIGPQNNGQGVFQLQQSPIPVAANIPRPTPPTPQTAPQAQMAGTPGPTLGADGLPLTNLDKTDRVVEEAVQEAVDRQRWPTAYALRTLYDDHRTNPRIVRLIEAIYNGRASEAQYGEFKSIMRQKKKEGKKDRTGEYYFNGDGSDPAPNNKDTPPATVVPAIPPLQMIQPPPPAPYQTPYRDMGPLSRSLAGRSSSVSSAPLVSASPKEEEHEHISKKHRTNSFQPVSSEVNGTPTANGTASAASPVHANGAPNSVRSTPHKSRRARSQSTSSSLSSVDPETFEGEDPMLGGAANGADGGGDGRPGSAPSLTRLGGHPLAGLGLSLGLGLGAAPAKPHVSPYASHDNFVAAASSAETLARNQAQPITAPAPPVTKTGPKLFHFKPTPSVTTPSSTNKSPTTTTTTNTTSASTTTNHLPAAASTATSMAPAALLNSSSNSSAASFHHFPASFKAKNLAKFKGDPYDPNDKTSRLRRRARENTNAINGDIRDSFERHQVQVASAQETDSDGEGGSLVAPAVSKRPPKVRLLNNKTNIKTRETRQRNNNNYDSEDLSSPTLLSFAPDVAPGSLSVSRAGTPSNFNRPTRKPRTGTGLRVKTS